MGECVNLLRNYPKTKRDPFSRAANKTEEDRSVARRFGKEFFDGDRRFGYGGFTYHPRFWENVVPDIMQHYSFKGDEAILDVGCAKGFMIYDFQRMYPNLALRGVDVSSYAIQNSLEIVRNQLSVASAVKLPFSDNSFDLVISVNTLHNLDGEELDLAFKEVSRVSKRHSFIVVDAYKDDIEKEAMFAWNLTAKTIKSVEEWKKYFEQVGYLGDYYWFTP